VQTEVAPGTSMGNAIFLDFSDSWVLWLLNHSRNLYSISLFSLWSMVLAALGLSLSMQGLQGILYACLTRRERW
jgi:hypothetical protein